MKTLSHPSRRRFLKTTLLGGLGAMSVVSRWRAAASPAAPAKSRVALTIGADRADAVFRGMQPFAAELRRAVANRRIVIKPNNVSIDTQLSATYADHLEGILESLKSIGRTDNIVIAESAASGPTLEGFANYGYDRVAAKYGAKLVDLDAEETELVYVFDEKDFQPHAVRTAKMLLDRDNFIISAARMKTHDRVVATLSLKNIVFGAPIKDTGFRWGPNRATGAQNDKPIAHGSGFRGINYNLFVLSQRLRPDLAVIDGIVGMEGNGPVGGSPVDHRVCVVSPDWVAADRVGVELMGIDFANVGYLSYCARANRGETDLARIEIIGPRVTDHIRPYTLHRNIDQQLVWKQA